MFIIMFLCLSVLERKVSVCLQPWSPPRHIQTCSLGTPSTPKLFNHVHYLANGRLVPTARSSCCFWNHFRLCEINPALKCFFDI